MIRKNLQTNNKNNNKNNNNNINNNITIFENNWKQLLKNPLSLNALKR